MNPTAANTADIAREALLLADEAYQEARRAISSRQRKEVDEAMYAFDGLLDKADEAYRSRQYDLAKEYLTGAKLKMRELVGVQTEHQRKEVDILLARARDAMQDAISFTEDALRSSEWGDVADRMLRQAAKREADDDDWYVKQNLKARGLLPESPPPVPRQPMSFLGLLFCGVLAVMAIAVLSLLLN